MRWEWITSREKRIDVDCIGIETKGFAMPETTKA